MALRIVPGIHSVREAFRVRPKAIKQVFLKEGDLSADLEALLQDFNSKKIPVKRVHTKSLDREVFSHQGIIAHVEGGPEWPTQQELRVLETALILVFDGLEDPHNVGSLMRTAWILGSNGAMASRDRAASDGPAAQKVASGAFEHIPWVAAPNLVAELKALKDLGFWVYGLSEKGKSSLPAVSLGKKAVLVIGSEESGLRKSTEGVCDDFVTVPQSDAENSLNAAVAGAIAVYEFHRQLRGVAK